jgi:hypothetical protein
VTDDTDFDDFENFNPDEGDPDIAAAVAAATQAVAQPEIPLPEDGPVDLPGGFRRLNLGGAIEEVTKAWVKELSGADEEHIAKARIRNDPNAFADAILEAGVERLGDRPPTAEELRELLVGDRETLLLEISRATYGDVIEYEDFTCPHCGDVVSFDVNKTEDIPVARLTSMDDAEFTVELRKGKSAVARLATGIDQQAAAKAGTGAEAVSAVLSRVVLSIQLHNGDVISVSDNPDAVRTALSTDDRFRIMKEQAERSPGPQYNEVTFTHPECGRVVEVPVGLMHLFRSL